MLILIRRMSKRKYMLLYQCQKIQTSERVREKELETRHGTTDEEQKLHARDGKESHHRTKQKTARANHTGPITEQMGSQTRQGSQYIYTSNSLGKSPLRDTGPEQWKHFGKIPPSQESDGWLWIPGFRHAWCALRNQGKYPVRTSLWVLSSQSRKTESEPWRAPKQQDSVPSYMLG